MKLVEADNKLIIRYVPIFQWILGGFLFLFAFLLFLFILYANLFKSNNSWSDYLAVLFLTSVFVFLVLQIKMIFKPRILLTLDKNTKSIEIQRHNIYRKKTRRFYFHQIDKFKSYKQNLNFSSKYFLALVLCNRKTLKLEIPIDKDQKETRKFVRKLNKLVKELKSNKIAI